MSGPYILIIVDCGFVDEICCFRKNAKELSKKFFDRPMSPMDTAAFWIEYVARHGRKALRSPVVDMPWWQANLIDVYSFMVATTVTILYVFVYLLKRIFSLCLSLCRQSERIAKKHQ